jgi:hypothetical protein
VREAVGDLLQRVRHRREHSSVPLELGVRASSDVTELFLRMIQAVMNDAIETRTAAVGINQVVGRLALRAQAVVGLAS